jgi:soluble lytic murein transglycosylase-like protein
MKRILASIGLNRLLFLMVLTALLSCSTGSILVERHDYFYDPRSEVKEVFARPTASELAMERSRLTAEDRSRIDKLLNNSDAALVLYRDPHTRNMVIDYFCRLAGSDEIALSILYHADRDNVPLLLAFSLAYVESKYQAVAVNVNAGSVDRGIFQLNNLSFPSLSVGDFFHPETNIAYGIDHLRWCLKYARDEQTALAIYNAGLSRVSQGGIPSSTREYVYKITRFERELSRDFRNYIRRNIETA